MTRFPLRPAIDPRREKRRKRIRTILVGLGVIALVVIVFFGYQKLKPYFEKKESIGDSVCQLSNEEAFMAVQVEGDKIEVNHYLFYGETLNFYQNPYQIAERDSLFGYSITLKNVCDSALEYVFLVDDLIDGQIALEILEEGFYELYMTKDFITYRVYSDSPQYSEIFTVIRSGEGKRIEVIANADIFINQDNEQRLEEDYYFINVSNEVDQNQPAVLIYVDNRNELEDSELVAEGLQAALELKGIQSIILFSEEELWTAIETKKANYFIGLSLSDKEEFNFYYSSLSSARLVSAVANAIEVENKINIKPLSPTETTNYISMILHAVGGKSTLDDLEFDSLSQQEKERLETIIFGKQGIFIVYPEELNSTYLAEQIAKELSNYLDISK